MFLTANETKLSQNTDRNARTEVCASEMYHQVYQAGGCAEPQGAMEMVNLMQSKGYSRDEAVAAMNIMIDDGDVEAGMSYTGLVQTLKIA